MNGKIYLYCFKLCFFLLLLIAINNISEGNDLIDLDSLIRVLENKGTDWRIQIDAIDRIAESADPRGSDILIKFLNDPFLNYDCPALKFHAAMALGRYKGDSRVIETLIEVASDNDNPLTVREVAINSLGEIGDRRSLKILLNMLNHDSFALRIASIRALGKIGDPSTIPVLEALLDKDRDLENEIRIVLHLLMANGNKN